MTFHRSNCSASGMFVFNGVSSFMEMWRINIDSFTQRLTNSDNAIVAATFPSCRRQKSVKRFERSNSLDTVLYKNYLFRIKLSSHFLKRWDCILYTASDSY